MMKLEASYSENKSKAVGLTLKIEANYPTFMMNGLYHQMVCNSVVKATIDLLESFNEVE